MRKLCLYDEIITTDPEIIVIEQEKFHKKLYSKTPEAEKVNSNFEFLNEELKSVATSLQTNKSAGNDGFTAKFYQVFGQFSAT